MDIKSRIKILDREISQAKNKFGKKSTAVNHYYFLRLCLYLHQSNSQIYIDKKRIYNTLKSISKTTFDSEKIIFIENPVHIPSYQYVYDKTIYDKKFNGYYLKYKDLIYNQLSYTYQHKFMFNKYIYVISTTNEFQYFNIPQSEIINIVGNKDASKFPFHPILSEKFSLKIKVGGEISFIWRNKKSVPALIYVNNISGHFIPKDWKSEELNVFIRNILNLPIKTSIICLANDGISISGLISKQINKD